MARLNAMARCYHCWNAAYASSEEIFLLMGWDIVPVFGIFVWLCPDCQMEGV